jgi:hypothetical protein
MNVLKAQLIGKEVNEIITCLWIWVYVKVVRLWGWWESARFRQRDENVAGCGSELRCRIWDDKFEVNGDLTERKLERIAKKKEVMWNGGGGGLG